MAELEFGEIGLTPSHAFILMTVNEKREIGTGEIARELFLAPSTVTRLIDKLVSMDLVDRKTDGKYVKVVATPRGLERDLRIRKAWDNLSRKFNNKVGKPHVDRLTDGIKGGYVKLINE